MNYSIDHLKPFFVDVTVWLGEFFSASLSADIRHWRIGASVIFSESFISLRFGVLCVGLYLEFYAPPKKQARVPDTPEHVNCKCHLEHKDTPV